MLRLNWDGMQGEIGALMARYNELPRYIAKKHLLAAIKRVGKDGVDLLKANTPVGGTRKVIKPKKRDDKGRYTKGSGKKVNQRGGALRRAAMVKAKYQGRNKDGYAYGVLGYKYGAESLKGIWLEYGTSRGVKPRKMIDKTMQQWGGPSAKRLADEMATALERAAAELASGMNPGKGSSGFGPGRP